VPGAVVRLAVGCATLPLEDSQPFRGVAIFNDDGVTIRGNLGRLRAAYWSPEVRSVRMHVTDERGVDDLANGFGTAAQVLDLLLSWWPFDLPDTSGGTVSSVRRTGTLEVATGGCTWYLRVFHRAPHEVTRALPPWMKL
jgi:hypothetical protein